MRLLISDRGACGGTEFDWRSTVPETGFSCTLPQCASLAHLGRTPPKIRTRDPSHIIDLFLYRKNDSSQSPTIARTRPETARIAPVAQSMRPSERTQQDRIPSHPRRDGQPMVRLKRPPPMRPRRRAPGVLTKKSFRFASRIRGTATPTDESVNRSRSKRAPRETDGRRD